MAKSMDTITCKLQSLEERLQAENESRHIFENRTAAAAAEAAAAASTVPTSSNATTTTQTAGRGASSGGGPQRRPQLTGCKYRESIVGWRTKMQAHAS